ncbi:ABC transporter permease [Arthrobacter ramosus]|uniref:ABC transporter permease n=2 Tax=Arthrobacter ramosus TaxID=1672 RepID=A0ABV5Y4L4_ARTRM
MRSIVAAITGRYILLLVLAIIAIGFSIARPETYGTWDNFRSILNTQIPVLFLAIAATLPFIVGEFDLSLAATGAFVNVFFVGLVLKQGWPVWAAVITCLAAALAMGLFNGFAIVRLGISSFIVTLASGTILAGILLAYSGGEIIYGDAPAALTFLGRTSLGGLPLPVIFAAIVSVFLAIVLWGTTVGRRMYASGSNRRAAQLTGIPTNRYLIVTFVIAAVLAAVAGLVLGSRLGSATPDTSNTLLIPAFAGAFLGATGFSAGRFNIPGTVVAVFIVGAAVNGLQQIGAAIWVQPVFNGVVLFVAVALAQWTQRLRAASAKRERLREIEALAKHDAETHSKAPAA